MIAKSRIKETAFKKIPGGTHDIFARGVPLYGPTLTLSGIFEEKVGYFSEILCPMEVSKIQFWGLFWEKMASIFQNFLKIVGF